MQASGEPNQLQSVALTVAGVPDGEPSQPYNATPYCVTRDRRAGRRSWRRAPELQFEGDGAYTVTVTVGPSGRRRDRLPVRAVHDRHVHGRRARRAPAAGLAAELPRHAVGRRRSTACAPPTRPAGWPTSAARSTRPCAGRVGHRHDRRPRATDGRRVPEPVRGRSFPRPGVWTCVARAAAEGVDEEFSPRRSSAARGRPRSRSTCAATSAARAAASTARRARRPRFTFTAEFPAEAAGGKATITLYRVTGCRDREFRLRRAARFRGTLRREAAPASRSSAPPSPATTSAASRSAAPASCAPAATRRRCSSSATKRTFGFARALRPLPGLPAALVGCCGRADPAAALRGQDRPCARRSRGAALARLRRRADRQA